MKFKSSTQKSLLFFTNPLLFEKVYLEDKQKDENEGIGWKGSESLEEFKEFMDKLEGQKVFTEPDSNKGWI